LRRVQLTQGGALVASGTRQSELSQFRPGTTVRAILGLRPSHPTLRTVIGGWPRIVVNGKSVAHAADPLEGTFPRFSAVRHPRTAIGFSRDSSRVFLVAVDGRRESGVGMSLVELARLMLTLGAFEAINLDGGGSTTMVVDGGVVNSPSDKTGERPVGSALLVVVDR
jgi:exopolysaccharide biosynthesis protein